MGSAKSSIKLPVVVDTNVFVSAFIWGGYQAQVVKLWQEKTITLILSPFLLSEIILVLERFGFPKEDLQNLKRILEKKSFKLLPPKNITLCRDEKDNQVLDLCLAGKARYLVTGDKDLLVLKEFRGTRIVKPKRFLEYI